MSSVDLPLAVFIVDDESPARHHVKELLGDCAAQISLELVGEASNGRDALEQLAEEAKVRRVNQIIECEKIIEAELVKIVHTSDRS